LRWWLFPVLFVLVLVIIPLAVMSPYLAAHFANMFDRPYTDRQRTADGGVVTTVHDRRMQPPAWITLPRGAIVTEADRAVDSGKPGAVGGIAFTAWQSFPVLKAFYTDSLTKQGFTVTDYGIGPVDEQSAKTLGVYGTVLARRGEEHEEVTIGFDEEKGLLQTARIVQIGWKEGRVP
jgi:hypothetical protein